MFLFIMAYLASEKVEKYLTSTSSRRKPSAIRALQPLMKVPGMISLGAGSPNPGLFPFTGIEFSVGESKYALSQTEIRDALQYSPTPGIPALISELQNLQQREHSPPYADFSVLTSTGGQGKSVSQLLYRCIAQSSSDPVHRASFLSFIRFKRVYNFISILLSSVDSLWKAFEMLLEPGDSVIVESYTYSGALAWLHPYGAHLIGVDMDSEGKIFMYLFHLLLSIPYASGIRALHLLGQDFLVFLFFFFNSSSFAVCFSKV